MRVALLVLAFGGAAAYVPARMVPAAPRALVASPRPAVRRTAAISASAATPDADFRLAASLVVLGPTLVLAPWLIQGVGGFFTLLGLFLLFQTARIRFEFDDEALEAARLDLNSILEHVARIGSIDVEGVSPMPRPLDTVNRLAEDEPGPTLDQATVLDLAPATEGEFIAVPKVLGEGGA